MSAFKKNTDIISFDDNVSSFDTPIRSPQVKLYERHFGKKKKRFSGLNFSSPSPSELPMPPESWIKTWKEFQKRNICNKV